MILSHFEDLVVRPSHGGGTDAIDAAIFLVQSPPEVPLGYTRSLALIGSTHQVLSGRDVFTDRSVPEWAKVDPQINHLF